MFHRFSHWISQKSEVAHTEEQEQLQLRCLTSLREATEFLIQTCNDRNFDANAPCTEEDSCVHAFGIAFQDCVHVGLNPNLSWWHLLSSCSLILNEPMLKQSVEIADMLSPVRTFQVQAEK
nr:AlNc14C265G9875 [Albugo laibachii Nc14]|eukprot:CCA24929.1 AlNc14C265G9875 [Albugo laibachii Nc14]